MAVPPHLADSEAEADPSVALLPLGLRFLHCWSLEVLSSGVLATDCNASMARVFDFQSMPKRNDGMNTKGRTKRWRVQLARGTPVAEQPSRQSSLPLTAVVRLEQMKLYLTICVLAFAGCSSPIAWQDIPACPQRLLPTPEERSNPEGNPDIYAKMGDLYAGPDCDRAEGLACYNEALKIDPNHVRANLGAAIVYSRCGNPDGSMPHWEKVVKYGVKGSPERAYAEGMIRYLKQERRKSSRTTSRTMLRHTNAEPEGPECLLGDKGKVR
jgi:hypothetical protein